MRRTVAVCSFIVLVACAPPPLTEPNEDVNPEPADSSTNSDAGGQVAFATVADLLRNKCNGSLCHGTDSPSGFKMKNGADATDKQIREALEDKPTLKGDAKLVVPGEPDSSVLYTAILGQYDNSRRMPPPPKERLSKSETSEIRRWIARGASYE